MAAINNIYASPAAQTNPNLPQNYGRTDPAAPSTSSTSSTPASTPTTTDTGDPKAAAKAAAAKQKDILNQLNSAVSTAGYTDVNGQGVTAFSQRIADLLSQLPANVANQWMTKTASGFFKSYPTVQTAVSNAVQSYGMPASTTGGLAQPFYDPLALQTMWKDVFGPAFNTASQLAGSVGPGYLSSMQQAIAGSNATPQNKAQMTSQAQAMANLLQGYGKAQTTAAAAQIPYDTLISTLQGGAQAAQTAAGQYEMLKGYGAAMPFLNTSGTGGALTPSGAAATVQSALGGATTPTATTNPFYPRTP